jgi:hypothetical protein
MGVLQLNAAPRLGRTVSHVFVCRGIASAFTLGAPSIANKAVKPDSMDSHFNFVMCASAQRHLHNPDTLARRRWKNEINGLLCIVFFCFYIRCVFSPGRK